MNPMKHARYSDDQMIQMIESVEAQGGVFVDAACEPRFYDYQIPTAKPDQFNTKTHPLGGCGQNSVFSVPYVKPDGTESTLQVCAREDLMGHWPRFIDEVLGA